MKVNFVDGAEVKQNDVLFEIDSRPYLADLKNKEALVVQSQRHSERLKSDFERAEKMLPTHAISQEQYDQYRFDYIESQSAFQAASASRDSSQLNVDYTKVLAPICWQGQPAARRSGQSGVRRQLAADDGRFGRPDLRLFRRG